MQLPYPQFITDLVTAVNCSISAIQPPRFHQRPVFLHEAPALFFENPDLLYKDKTVNNRAAAINFKFTAAYSCEN